MLKEERTTFTIKYPSAFSYLRSNHAYLNLSTSRVAIAPVAAARDRIRTRMLGWESQSQRTRAAMDECRSLRGICVFERKRAEGRQRGGNSRGELSSVLSRRAHLESAKSTSSRQYCVSPGATEPCRREEARADPDRHLPRSTRSGACSGSSSALSSAVACPFCNRVVRCRNEDAIERVWRGRGGKRVRGQSAAAETPEFNLRRHRVKVARR